MEGNFAFAVGVPRGAPQNPCAVLHTVLASTVQPATAQPSSGEQIHHASAAPLLLPPSPLLPGPLPSTIQAVCWLAVKNYWCKCGTDPVV